MMMAGRDSGAARRPRERRLRGAWRHEQLSVAVALAAFPGILDWSLAIPM